jgi:predicted aspartyl protease
MRRTCLTALAIVAAPLQAQPPTSVFDTIAEQGEVDDTTEAEDVGFGKDRHDRMTVDVQLSGRGPFQFLVDTGADRTAISRDVAARLGLEAGEAAALHTVTGTSIVRTATIPHLQWSRTPVTVVDAPVLEAKHMGADGILGTDSLRSQRVMFDFENRVMTIVPSRQRVDPKDEGTIVVTGRLRNGRLIVTDAVADGNRITVVLDTGSEVSIGNEALRRRLARRGLLKDSGSIELLSVTGEILHGQYTFLKKLDMGEVEFGDLAIVFAEAHTFKQLGLEERPALLLGMNALQAFKKVSIDFANKKLRVMLPEQGSRDSVQLAAR